MANTPDKYRCGPCGQEFATEQEYLDHVCPQTGYAPTDPGHQGPEFKAIQEAALKRGEDRKNEGKE